MNIDCGKYILRSDSLCIWIEEKRNSKKETGKGYNQRITGYMTSFSSVAADFLHEKMLSEDDSTIETVLSRLASAEKEIEGIQKRYAAELKADDKVRKSSH